MKPQLKRVHSPEVDDLERFVPLDPARFGVLVQLMVGPEDADGAETFDLVVCTPQWLIQLALDEGPVNLRHHLLVATYEWSKIVGFVESFLDGIEYDSWPAVAAHVGRLGRWEFEDYEP